MVGLTALELVHVKASELESLLDVPMALKLVHLKALELENLKALALVDLMALGLVDLMEVSMALGSAVPLVGLLEP